MSYGTAPIVFQGASASAVGSLLDRLVERGVLKDVATVETKPANVPEKTLDQVKNEFDPWYKKWWVWTIVGVGVVGTGLTIYFVRRRR